MSYTYLQDAGEESSAESFSAIPASVLSRLNLTPVKSYCNDSATESCHASQSGTTLEPSMEIRGGAAWMWFAAGSHALTSVAPAQERELKGREVVFGLSSLEQLKKYNLDWWL